MSDQNKQSVTQPSTQGKWNLDAKDLPCKAQTSEQFQEWYERTQPQAGDPIVVRVVHGGIANYTLDVIEKVNHGRQKRIITKGFGSFYRSGKNCFHPTGQTRLVEPTPAVVEAAKSRDFYGSYLGYIS